MPSDYTVIDDNPPDTWDNAFWIRQDNPRKYPTDESDIPAVVKAQRETMLRLPKAANSLLPHDFLAILNFVHDADMYPRLRQAVIISPIKFSPLPPDTNPHAIVKALRGRTVPPLEAIREARKNLGQEWFNGNVSVIDSHYADYPLPFWVLTLWYELHFVHKDRLKWASTEERIRSASFRDEGLNLDLHVIKDSLMACMRDIGWRTPISGFPSAGWRGELELAKSSSLPSEGSVVPWTTAFIQFFENGFLDDEAINMMLHWIDRQVQRNTGASQDTIIANLSFTSALRRHYDEASERNYTEPAILVLTRQQAVLLGRTQLFFVLNSGGNHWATVKVDFKERTYAYGDSLAAIRPPDKRTLDALAYWLNSTFLDGDSFSTAPILPCEQQSDGFSCGITACTIISNALGIDKPWTRPQAKIFRYRWALRLMQTHHTCSTMGYKTDNEDEQVFDLSSAPTSPVSEFAELPLLAPSVFNPENVDSVSCDSETKDLPVATPVTKSHRAANIPGSDAEFDLDYTKPASPIDSDHSIEPREMLFGDITDLNDHKPEEIKGAYTEKNGILHFSDDSDNETQDRTVSIPAPDVLIPAAMPASATSLGKHKRSQSVEEIPPPSHGSKRLGGPAAHKRPAGRRKSPVWSKQLEDRQSGPVGISKTATTDRKKLQGVKDGTLTVDKRSAMRMLSRVHEKYDPDATLDPKDPRYMTIIHSLCGKPIHLDGPNRTSKFSRHVSSCSENRGLRKNGKFTKAAQGCEKISDFFKRADTSKTLAPEPLDSTDLENAEALMYERHLSASGSPSPSPSSVLVPCCGLRPDHDSRIQHVIERGAIGGKVSQHSLAQKEFKKAYRNLTDEQKLHVLTGATATARWICYYTPVIHIRSTKCEQQCNPATAEVNTGPTDICNRCADLLHLGPFQTAMAKPVPKTENLKFVPKSSQNKLLGVLCSRYKGLEDLLDESTMSPLMKLAIKTSKGDIKTPKLFMGLVEAMVVRDSRISRGKGLQGIRYPPAWIDFCSLAYVVSPRAYDLLKSHGLPVVHERTLRHQRSSMPKFPMGIIERTFDRAINFLKALGYNGPVCISCDDTQLCSKLTPYYDGEHNKWFIIGAIGEPVEVDGKVEDIKEIIAAAGQRPKATKLRLWCLQVAVPTVPVFILAAMAIGPSLKAQDLADMHSKLIDGLLAAEICVASFIKSATNQKTVLIPHALAGFPPYTISLPLYGPNYIPIVSIQDSKHALKTYRNNLFSGTRCLTIGNRVVCYQQVRELANDPRSPLYRRDVDKVDRQDDRAAMRVFSCAMLEHALTVNQELKESLKPNPALGGDLGGLCAYLFIFGDLFDAFQNRFLTVTERCKMVLRAWYFLDIWKSSLAALRYSESTHFITREAYDITKSLVQGFLGLVIIHRDHLDHDNYPYLPWLHSTEPCEHTFGEARKLRPDFTMGDFLSMQPKLAIITEQSVKNSDSEDEANARACAAGYFNTLYSSKGLDVLALASHPTNYTIFEVAKQALYEAEAVFNTCEVPANSFYRCPEPASCSLPPVSQFLSEIASFDDDSESNDIACPLAEEPFSMDEQFQSILQAEETQGFSTIEFSEQMDAYTVAAVALNVEQQNEIDLLPDGDTENDWENIRRRIVQEYPRFPLPPLVIADEVRRAMCQSEQTDIDTSQMISIRQAHETHFAKKAMRIGSSGSLTQNHSNTTVPDHNDTPENSNEARKMMVKCMHECLKEYEDSLGVTTGANRRARYGGAPAKPLVGNAMNASVVVNNRIKDLMTLRGKVAAMKKLNCRDLVVNAGISAVAPLEVGLYAIVLVEKQLWLAEVITLYLKGTGKGGTYGWIKSANHVAGFSYAVVQLWEHWNSQEFRSIVKGTAAYHAYRFAHVPWQAFLYVTRRSSVEQLSPERLKASNSLLKAWHDIKAELPFIELMVAELLRRKRNLEDDDENND